MCKRTRLNPTAQALRPLFAAPLLLAQAIRWVLTDGPVTITPATTDPTTEARRERIRAARAAGIIDAPQNSPQWQRQMLAASDGCEVISAHGRPDDPDVLAYEASLPVADLAPVLALPYYPMPAAAQQTVPAAPKAPRTARKGKATVSPASQPAKRQAKPRATPRAKPTPAAARVKPDQVAEAVRRVGRGESVRAAARACGVAESTLRGRLKRATVAR